jgi:hypothetical protein
MTGSVLNLILVLGSFGEVFEASFCKALQALGLGKECRAQPSLDAALAYTASEAGDGGGTAGDADVRVLTLTVVVAVLITCAAGAPSQPAVPARLATGESSGLIEGL